MDFNLWARSSGPTKNENEIQCYTGLCLKGWLKQSKMCWLRNLSVLYAWVRWYHRQLGADSRLILGWFWCFVRMALWNQPWSAMDCISVAQSPQALLRCWNLETNFSALWFRFLLSTNKKDEWIVNYNVGYMRRCSLNRFPKITHWLLLLWPNKGLLCSKEGETR